VAVVVTDGNKGLETCALTGTGLLLDGHNLQNLILEPSVHHQHNNVIYGKTDDLNKTPIQYPLIISTDEVVRKHHVLC